MKFGFWIVAVFVFVISPGPAGAQTGNVDVFFCSVDNSAGGPALDGFVTSQIRQNFTGQWTGAQLLLELTTGSIFRADLGTPSGTAPNPAFFDLAPDLEFDSYFGIPGDPDGGTAGAGAVDLGGSAIGNWPATTTSAPFTLSQAWNPPGGAGVIDRDDFQLAQLTLSNDVSGTWSLLTSVGGQITTFDGTLTNGFLTLTGHPDCEIPEPSSLALLGLAGLGLATSRARPRRR